MLYDPALDAHAPAQLPGLHDSGRSRARELGDGAPALYGARAALGAIEMLGHAAERIAVGLGPAPATASAELEIDQRAARAPARRSSPRLACASAITRRRRCSRVRRADHAARPSRTTPSAAVKARARAGYPVELKPWGHDLPTEPEGCPVERGVTSDALVRRAFAAVLAAAGEPTQPSAAR